MAVQLNGLIEYTDKQLEQMAHDYLRERPDVQFKIPVNVEALLENLVGDILLVPGILEMTRTEGVVCRHLNQKDLKVFLDEDVVNFGPKATYYAVVAEEVAHIILHQAIFIQVKSVPDFLEVLQSPQWHRIERDAKVYSAALRMPFRNLILAAESIYPEIVDEHGFGDLATVQKLLRNALAEKFVVPHEDMHRRLMQWPCRVYDRAAISTMCQEHILAGDDAVAHLAPRKIQTQMFE